MFLRLEKVKRTLPPIVLATLGVLMLVFAGFTGDTASGAEQPVCLTFRLFVPGLAADSANGNVQAQVQAQTSNQDNFQSITDDPKVISQLTKNGTNHGDELTGVATREEWLKVWNDVYGAPVSAQDLTADPTVPASRQTGRHVS